jgi:pilus assembly protein Flp/PilA
MIGVFSRFAKAMRNFFRSIAANLTPEENDMLQLSVITQNWIQLRLEEIRDRETGATAVEYALMVGLIAVGIIGAVAALRNKVSATFNNVNNAMGK